LKPPSPPPPILLLLIFVLLLLFFVVILLLFLLLPLLTCDELLSNFAFDLILRRYIKCFALDLTASQNTEDMANAAARRISRPSHSGSSAPPREVGTDRWCSHVIGTDV